MFTRYQRRVQWAKSILQEQGLDDCSITEILKNYTKPLELPLLEKEGAEQTGDSCNSTGPNAENTELSSHSSADTGSVVDPESCSPECHKGYQKPCLEGGPASDSVAALGPKEQKPADLKEAAEVSCQKHSFCVRCSCKAKENTEHKSCEMVESNECAPEYVLVEEEDESGLCPESDSAHEQENVRLKRVLFFQRNHVITANLRIWCLFPV